MQATIAVSLTVDELNAIIGGLEGNRSSLSRVGRPDLGERDTPMIERLYAELEAWEARQAAPLAAAS
jgi:hypothetical protein